MHIVAEYCCGHKAILASSSCLHRTGSMDMDNTRLVSSSDMHRMKEGTMVMVHHGGFIPGQGSTARQAPKQEYNRLEGMGSPTPPS